MGYGVGIRNMQTMTLKDIVESITYGMCPSNNRNDIIEFARKRIFNFEYESWNEEHKKRIETLFIKTFYFSEIGFETEGRFFFELENWFQTNMPYWNKLLESQIWESRIKNPFHNYEFTDNIITTQDKNSKIDNKTQTNDVSTSTTNEEMEGTANQTDSKTGRQDKTNTNNIQTQAEENSKNDTSTTNTNTGSIMENKSENTALNTNTSINENINNTTNENISDDTTQTTNNFNRTMEEDTPQNRISITPSEDGTGIINYASKIVESKDKNSIVTDNNISKELESDTERNETATGTETTNVTGNTTTSNTENGLVTGEEEYSKESEVSTNENATEDLSYAENQTHNTTENEQKTSNTTATGNQDRTEQTNQNEKGSGTENRYAFGSIGVARYDELLNGYRTIFKNYDKKILEAIHEDLFMLVY